MTTSPPGSDRPQRWRGHGAFRAVTLAFLVIVGGLIVFGLAHRSSSPDLLGRYSLGYAAVLAALAGLSAILAYVLVRPAGKLAELSKNAYTLVIATVLTLGLTELGLRLFAPWGLDFFHWLPYHMQGMVNDPDMGYAHPKNASYRLGTLNVRLNSRGLRDHEIPFAKPTGERRILVLGDSVAFGWGVDQGETFSDRMEPLLRSRTGQAWEVINAGVNGYNSEQEATFLAAHGWRYSPDIVIVVFVDNDVDPRLVPNEATWRRHWRWPASLPEAVDRLRQLSYLNQVTQVMARLQPQPAGAPRPSITEHPRWHEAHAALRRIAAACRERGVPLLVAHLSGDEKFLRTLSEYEIAAISLGPAWERVPQDRRRVSRVDAHPAAPVHEAFAELLVEEVTVRGWVGWDLTGTR